MTHPDSPEFIAILERLPRWHMLTPDEQIKDGDEIWHHGDQVSGVWKKVIMTGTVNSRPFRRPIPEHVRRSEAWWALYNQLATVDPDDHGVLIYNQNDIDFLVNVAGPFRKFKNISLAQAAIPILGGESEIIKNLQEGPGAYMRWVLGV